MPPKLPNSFSSLCAHRAAGSKNAAAQSSNDASFGDLREEAEARRGFRHEGGGRCPSGDANIRRNKRNQLIFVASCHRFPFSPARMRPSFHTLDRAFRHRRTALVENSTSFSQKLPVFAENSTTFRRKSARLHPLQPAVAAFSPIVSSCSPLIQHRFPNNPPSPLSIFAVTHSNTSATTKPKKWGALKLAQLHGACAETVN